MLFSVIIPFYNRAGLVAEVLDSVQSQTEHDYEIIAVDDGSTDDTLERLQKHPSRPLCFKIANQGAPRARNEAVKKAGGEYLAFLDSDDLWFPFTLSLYRKLIESENRPSIITGKPFLFRSREELQDCREKGTVTESFPTYYDSYTEWRWFGVSSFVIRRDAFFQAGGFANRRMNAEDADLMLRLGMAPGFVQIKAPHTFGYRQHDDNLTSNFSLGFAGIQHMVDTETAGTYPGNGKYTQLRRRILTRHVRPAILSALRRKRPDLAWPLFRSSFPWNLRQGKIGFLLFASLKLVYSKLLPQAKETTSAKD